MSYTFICTKEKEWYLKISSCEQLIEYWNHVFEPKLKHAFDTVCDTKEFGCGIQHCDVLQSLIGITARCECLSMRAAYEKILYMHKIGQYQALCNGKTLYINKKLGWNASPKDTEQFVHKNSFEFPIMEKERIKIEEFPVGKHFYIFIDGVQLRKNENLKFDSKQEALKFAQEYLPKEKKN